jgi:TIR domain
MAILSVFISHVEEDQALALEIARELEAVGFSTWYYERDSEPGMSYLLQVHAAIEQCGAVVVLISPDSVRSYQMTKEVVRAHETGKAFIPVRYNIAHAEFQQRQPEWNIAIGAAASIPVPPDGVAAIIPRITRGLQQLDPSGGGGATRSVEAGPAGGFDPKARPVSGPSEADAPESYAAHRASKAGTASQRPQPGHNPDRSGVESGMGSGDARKGNGRLHIAAGILGGLVVIGAGTYFFLPETPVVEPVPVQLSRTSPSPAPAPTPPPGASPSVEPAGNVSAQPPGVAATKLPNIGAIAPSPPTISKQSPQASARSAAPASTPVIPAKEPERETRERETTRFLGAAIQEKQRTSQLQIEMALSNIDKSLRSIEEAALENPNAEDPAVMQQMKEQRRRVDETKQKLKVTSDPETRSHLLQELQKRLTELGRIIEQVKAAPRSIKAG